MASPIQRGKTSKSSLAHRAQQKFNAGKYIEAIDALEKLILEVSPEQEYKVQHNLVIANFVGGRADVIEFELQLRSLLESMAEVHLESLKSKDKLYSKAITGSMQTSLSSADKCMDSVSSVVDTVCGGRHVTNKRSLNGNATASAQLPEYVLEREGIFIRYNLAAALFIRKQFATACSILEDLIRPIELVEDKLAMHICFLYLDIILHTSRGCIASELERRAILKKAQAVISFLEKLHIATSINHTNEQNGLTAETTTLPTTSAATPPTLSYSNAVTGNMLSAAAGSTSWEQDKKGEVMHADIIEFKFRLHLYRAKMLLLQCKLKAVKKEMKSALELFQKKMKTSREDVAIDGMDIRHVWHFPNNFGSLAVQNATALFLKANSEYLRRNYKKCIKLLASCSRDAVDECMLLNNMGCLHYQLGKHHAARSFFSRALEAATRNDATSKDKASVVLTSSPRHEIMYNNGVQLLVRGSHELAFRCFYSCSKMFYNRPKLWMRMGECCTRAYAKQQRSQDNVGAQSALIQGIVGSGSHRRVLLPTCTSSNATHEAGSPIRITKRAASKPPPTSTTSSPVAESGLSDGCILSLLARIAPIYLYALEIPMMNLSFAAKCFKNVLSLCRLILEQNESPNRALKVLRSEEQGVEEWNSKGLDAMRYKALINLSYIYLCINEPQLALNYAKELLAIPSCTKSDRFLATSYASEALCMLSRASEATGMLHHVRDLTAMVEEYSKAEDIKASQIRVGLYVNKATSLILQDRSAEAEESITRAVRENPGCRESLQLLVYVLVKKGDLKKALRVLKEAQVTV